MTMASNHTWPDRTDLHSSFLLPFLFNLIRIQSVPRSLSLSLSSFWKGKAVMAEEKSNSDAIIALVVILLGIAIPIIVFWVLIIWCSRRKRKRMAEFHKTPEAPMPAAEDVEAAEPAPKEEEPVEPKGKSVKSSKSAAKSKKSEKSEKDQTDNGGKTGTGEGKTGEGKTGE